MQLDLQGWHSNRPIFKRLLETVRPETYLELGTWKGASAIHVTQEAKKLGLPTKVFCVDMWSPDVIIQGSGCLVDQFMFNIRAMGCDDRIYPFQMRTHEAAVEFAKNGITAKLIYVDADHTHEGALADMENFYPLLEKGGVMFGDDVTEIPGVRSAVEEFCYRHNLYYRADYYHWELAPKA